MGKGERPHAETQADNISRRKKENRSCSTCAVGDVEGCEEALARPAYPELAWTSRGHPWAGERSTAPQSNPKQSVGCFETEMGNSSGLPGSGCQFSISPVFQFFQENRQTTPPFIGRINGGVSQ
jgi:hypothetical protein